MALAWLIEDGEEYGSTDPVALITLAEADRDRNRGEDEGGEGVGEYVDDGWIDLQ